MKKHILLLNIAVIIPYLIFDKALPWFFVLVLSLYNAYKAKTSKRFLIYNMILMLASSAGIIAVYYMDKAYGVGWHPERWDELRLIMSLHIVGMTVLTGIGLLFKLIDERKKKKPEKKIPENTYRVIKISKDALFEFVYEQFLDKQEQFLDITDPTTVVTSFGVDWDDSSFVFIARNSMDENDFCEDIDIQKISKALSDTTSTMYKNNRYIDLSENQIKDIQGEAK